MDTRGKTNAEQFNEGNETLSRHEASLDQVHASMQQVLSKLQALHPSGWIYKTEQYYDFKGIPPEQQIYKKLRNKDLTILIDGGSTHNFFDQAVVSRFGLPITRSKKFQVMVANKEKIECAGLCQSLTVEIQRTSTMVDFYVLPVVTCHLSSGYNGLPHSGPLRPIIPLSLCLSRKDGVPHTFQGITQQEIEVSSQKDFHEIRGLGLHGTTFFLQLSSSELGVQSNHILTNLDCLLTRFSALFEKSMK
ncbi:hypothetical protein FEM48_Zijuj07G0078400 [Ziziphus jujuba var. spinosa]|uniref:Uncharacterized protein n=1 Tax=Ziziphus jujuba var. spinosa TaxID=714518 RepID=A0A978V3E2_ZIZJJ|nr:hypothetical protein FEM48_Zijuj07G0078400 [Ziziphus jujuba var. spinosa]